MRTLYTRQELAKHLSITTRSVDNLRKRGMPTVNVTRSNAAKFAVDPAGIPLLGSVPMFDLAEVNRWLERERTRAGKGKR
jgi:hypothetical protein